MPNTTATETAAPKTDDSVLMWFLTQGGATIELHRQDREMRTDLWGHIIIPEGETRTSHGFNWRCLGCDAVGRHLSDSHYDEYEPRESRRDANDHASKCRAMPRPTA